MLLRSRQCRCLAVETSSPPSCTCCANAPRSAPNKTVSLLRVWWRRGLVPCLVASQPWLLFGRQVAHVACCVLLAAKQEAQANPSSCSISVTVQRAHNLPRRRAAEGAAGPTALECIVEARFDKQIEETPVAKGNDPAWNSRLRLNFEVFLPRARVLVSSAVLRLV